MSLARFSMAARCSRKTMRSGSLLQKLKRNQKWIVHVLFWLVISPLLLCVHGQVSHSFSTFSNYSSIVAMVSISQWQDHSCAILSGGTVKCWGRNSYGQVIIQWTTTFIWHVSINCGLTMRLFAAWRQLNDTSIQSCWSRGLGQRSYLSCIRQRTILCAAFLFGMLSYIDFVSIFDIGFDDYCSCSTVTACETPSMKQSDMTRWLQAHTCALLSGGTVKCWGWNHEGRVMPILDIDLHTWIVWGLTLCFCAAWPYSTTWIWNCILTCCACWLEQRSWVDCSRRGTFHFTSLSDTISRKMRVRRVQCHYCRLPHALI